MNVFFFFHSTMGKVGTGCASYFTFSSIISHKRIHILLSNSRIRFNQQQIEHMIEILYPL